MDDGKVYKLHTPETFRPWIKKPPFLTTKKEEKASDEKKSFACFLSVLCQGQAAAVVYPTTHTHTMYVRMYPQPLLDHENFNS